MSNNLPSAFKCDENGPYAEQDPDEDLDWWFDFNDGRKPCLQSGELIASIVEFNLTRIDGHAITTEETHDETNGGTYALIFVTKLLRGKEYNLETTVQTDHTPPRRYSRSFRLRCREL